MTEGRVSPQSTHLGCVIKSPVLVQLLGSGYVLLDAVSKGWVVVSRLVVMTEGRGSPQSTHLKADRVKRG